MDPRYAHKVQGKNMHHQGMSRQSGRTGGMGGILDMMNMGGFMGEREITKDTMKIQVYVDEENAKYHVVEDDLDSDIE